MYFARVATTYKNGETDRAFNYRPVSLLGSIYKIYMILIRAKVQAEVEPRRHKNAIWFPTGKEHSTRNSFYQKDARLRRKM